ncbi:hypothetical protein Cs7R123_36640 [Catellatospora sp. TT07R-123]|uniref:hypothetical protein n=1 Tax=Catellatospora sp. TT07R-123 TaxID=2733863 RepID=UPI001B2F42FF|nr:hypothetical protein [Catellatospora sp. TT07R-123]GHJ46322.1 hypothetical protein Cs7R123_36640 [Catellatospora sp. TT07R-123]
MADTAEPRDPWAVPADFTAWVERRLRPLERGTRQLEGEDQAAQSMARELLTVVAARWPRLRRADTRHGDPAGTAADRYLQQLFAREAADAGLRDAIRLDLDRPVPVPRDQPSYARTLTMADEAALLWERAKTTSRRRVLIGAGLGGFALVAAVCRMIWADPPEDEPTPRHPRAEASRSAVDTLPAAADQARLTTLRVPGLPAELAPGDAAKLPALSADPVTRALALLTPSATVGTPVLALGEDGRWRRVDQAGDRVGLGMEESALSPDGLHAAFALVDGVRVVDLATGAGRTYPTPEQPPAVAWLGPGHLLLGVDALLDLRAERLVPCPAGPVDAVTYRGVVPLSGPGPLTELLSVGQPAAAGARVRRWVLDAAKPGETTVAITGERADLIGPFQGPGFGHGDGVLARVCSARSGQQGQAVGVFTTDGAVRRVLLADESVTGAVRVIGWLDPRRVLLRCVGRVGSGPARQRILAWDLRDGHLALMATVAVEGGLSLPDLTGSV